MAHKEAILYQKQLEEEINEARIAEGKRPFGSIIRQEVVERKFSIADPESGYYVKQNEKNSLLILLIPLVMKMVLY